jgi:hypothetical protein
MNVAWCPRLASALVIGDDATLLAAIASMLAQEGHYLPLCEGPRLLRHDADYELARRHNLAARMQPKAIFLAGLSEEARTRFGSRFPYQRCFDLQSASDLRRVPHPLPMRGKKVLAWGRERIGAGLLKALREKRRIEFDDAPSPPIKHEKTSNVLVACEQGNELAEVLAANYAYAIGADLQMLPEIDEADADDLLERLYALYDDRDEAPSETLRVLKQRMRTMAGALDVRGYEYVTFVSSELPWAFAFPDVPATHIFKYPDLGIQLANAIVSEQPQAPGLRVGAVVDPQEVEAPEIEFTAKRLAQHGTLVRGYRGPMASVRNVSEMAELLPYDFLLFATHCGDAGGWRFTYEYKDREGIDRRLVVDVAVSATAEPGDDKISVMQFVKFVSIDGIDWEDREAKSKHYIGTAIRDYVERDRGEGGLQPVRRERVERVRWSAALKMVDDNLILPPVQLADYNCPIIVNNACASWHRLAKTFTFGGARVYIGTLFPVSNVEAQEVVQRLLGDHFSEPLARALWKTQREVYGEGRRPYMMVGPHFQRLRPSKVDSPKFLLRRLESSRARMQQGLAALGAGPGEVTDESRELKRRLQYLEFELAGMKRWLDDESTETLRT